MTGQTICAVIGANFGDEGKGLAVDHLCSGLENTLVVKHNGGAQAGHTVETEDKRFVFHQLSSGSFRRADTLLAETFFPDLYKLCGEVSDFRALSGHSPVIYADVNARITITDDVLLNMAVETSRGKDRHGSCGMGVYEAVLRSEAGFGITVGRLVGMTEAELASELARIRREYVLPRLERLAPIAAGEYTELLHDGNVLMNTAAGILKGAELITPVSGLRELSQKMEGIVFEGAQGLLLDWNYERYAPHLTASRTGLHNPLKLCSSSGLTLDRAIYVMRSYVTRHGAGPLPHECSPEAIGKLSPDRTNTPNEWQGGLRFGLYPSPEELAGAVLDDLSTWQGSAGLFITHLNETDGIVRFYGRDIPASELAYEPCFKSRIDSVFCSYSPYGAVPALSIRALARSLRKHI